MSNANQDPKAIDPDRLIALYGSLRDEPLRRRLGLAGRIRRLGRFRLQGILYDLGPYPGLAPGKGVVHGELYELLDGGALAVMDAYEEYDPRRPPKVSTYRRERWTLTDPDVESWVYVYNRPVRGLTRVLGGDWLARRKRQGPRQAHEPFGNN
jgi:gamma-glutamylcyclotransferase (GGCT)/AIG2-like uncharacterized protein YtfP